MPFMYLIVDENQTNGGDPSGEFTESCHVKKLIAYWKHHTHTHSNYPTPPCLLALLTSTCH